MSQQTRSSTIYTCDRCANTGEFTEPRQYACWANITTQYKTGGSILPNGYQAALCVDCAADFAEWFRAGRDES